MWSTGTIAIISILGIAIALTVYVFIFIFISGSSSKGLPYDEFVMFICSPKGTKSFMSTVFTWGYFKRSFKNCLRHYRLKLFPVPKAMLGKACPDAKLVALDGTVKSLAEHYLKLDDMPVILNMGSYT